MEVPSPGYVFKPFAGSSHWLTIRILSGLKSPLRVCDVGTGEGFLSRECRARGHTVLGIDRTAPTSGRDAWNRFVTADLTHLPIQGIDPAERFDLFILADVLEHVPDPLSLLAEFSRYSTPESLFVISVPNVANLYVRLSLLAGRFDYTGHGILDAGHLRFFTLATFADLLQKAGLSTERLWATSIPFPLVWPMVFRGGRLNWINRMAFGVTNLWKSLLGYQFVALARPGTSYSFREGNPRGQHEERT